MSPRVSEVAEASLEIRNVITFLFRMSDESRREKYHLNFHCGYTIGIPADWEFYFEKDHDGERNVMKAVVELDEDFEPPEDLKVIKTEFQIDFWAGGVLIETYYSGEQIFRPKPTNRGKECWVAEVVLDGTAKLKRLIDKRGDGGNSLTADLTMTVYNECYHPDPVEDDEDDYGHYANEENDYGYYYD